MASETFSSDLMREVIGGMNRPGVGKTTVIREIARVLADELHKRVVWPLPVLFFANLLWQFVILHSIASLSTRQC